MDQSAISVRYAKAFFATAKEKKLLDVLKSDIQLVLETCDKSTDFILLLESPVVKSSKKSKLITSVFEGKVHELTMNFLMLIVENKREVYIPGICRNFLALCRKDQNIKSAVLITANEMSEKTIEKVGKLLEKELKTKVELSTQVNEDIVGGLIIRLEDTQFDASVATQIRKIKQKLLESEIK
ncbi:MAG: ATP synthase F1 subunit delta [Draconibacterium sp.]